MLMSMAVGTVGTVNSQNANHSAYNYVEDEIWCHSFASIKVTTPETTKQTVPTIEPAVLA